MILPKTTIEQRSTFYHDVEALLSPGFLTHAVTVAGVRFQLRSLSTGDLFMLRARTEGASSREWRVWMVASSIWMVDGQSVLGQDSAVPFLAKYLRGMPPNTLNILFSVLLGLFSRVQKAVNTVVAFSYEAESRYKWATYGKAHTTLGSGVAGSERLGLNTVQQIWVAFNQHEDQRILDDQQWDGFKLVASSNAPKALQKLDEADQRRRKEEKERREAFADTTYYTRLGLLDPEKADGTTLGSSHRMQSKSVEDLEDEMRRWVTGDADIHDQVVAEYKANIRAQREQEKAEQAARRAALQAERERQEQEALSTGFRPQPLMALTGSQLQQMLQGRGSFGRSGTTFIPSAPHGDRLYDKYVAEGAVVPGNLKVQGDKVLDPQANPEADARTLNQLLKGRNPAFGSGE